jgi:hypothetical protein
MEAERYIAAAKGYAGHGGVSELCDKLLPCQNDTLEEPKPIKSISYNVPHKGQFVPCNK